MKKGLSLIKFELKTNILNLKIIFLIIVLPLLAVILFNFAFKNLVGDEAIIKIGIVDEEDSLTSNYLKEEITKDEDYLSLISFEYIEKKDSLERVKENNLNAVLVIPENFTSNLINMKNDPIEIIYNKEDILTSYIIQEMLSSFSTYIEEVQKSLTGTYRTVSSLENLKENKEEINNKLSYIMIAEVFNRKNKINYIEIEDIATTSSNLYILIMIEILLLSYISLFFTNKFRKEKLINTRLETLGLSKFKVKILKIFSYLILANIQVFLVFFPFFYYITKSLNIIYILFLNLVILLMFSFWFGISSFILDNKNFILTGTLIIMFSNILGGTIFPIFLMPYNLKLISKFTINYWIGKEFLNLTKGNLDIITFSLIIISTGILFFISSKGEVLDA